ncbi:MAG: helix-turn-helix domain-containing protein [Parasporobacterium sp.]|nr:helix-turn-helix domain-containing protein [Parasporobacterium sp.]
MKITAGILFYLLDRYGDMQHICHGADRMKLKRFEHFRNQKETEAGVLYIYADKKGVLLFCGEKKYKPSYILMKALKETDEDFSSLWIPYVNLDESAESRAHLADEVFEYVGQIWNYFTQIQNEVLEAIINQEPIEKILEKVRSLLREPFNVVDREMLLLYQSPELREQLKETMGEHFGEELENELLVAKEFHEAARKNEPFYYYVELLEQTSYCINIVVDGYYYARLVVPVQKGYQQLSSGAEQLSEYLSSVLVQMIRHGVLQVQKSQEDLLHRVCIEIAGGVRPEPSRIREAVAGYSWNETDEYQVFCLEPYHASGWETQIENTIPTIARKLEQIWPQTCAAFVGKQILWIVNHSKMEKRKGSEEFEQRLVVFLRENVFRVGGSSWFQNAALFASAFREASAALEIGTKKDSSYWFYRFDDYRLAYMLDAIREKEIDISMLVHPVIPKLMEHDRNHESQLADTLKMLVMKQGNVSQAADALFIHRTTLFRRLNQIKEMTGLNLEDTDLILELQISYRILE